MIGIILTASHFTNVNSLNDCKTRKDTLEYFSSTLKDSIGISFNIENIKSFNINNELTDAGETLMSMKESYMKNYLSDIKRDESEIGLNYCDKGIEILKSNNEYFSSTIKNYSLNVEKDKKNYLITFDRYGKIIDLIIK